MLSREWLVSVFGIWKAPDNFCVNMGSTVLTFSTINGGGVIGLPLSISGAGAGDGAGTGLSETTFTITGAGAGGIGKVSLMLFIGTFITVLTCSFFSSLSANIFFLSVFLINSSRILLKTRSFISLTSSSA